MAEKTAVSNSSVLDLPADDLDLEGWEEWSGEGSFLHHCIAGSMAGISEHVLMFPFDTYKTHLQFTRGHSTLTFWQLMQREGFPRLWRGAPAMVVASVPSHAAYFSAYEAGKVAFGANAPGHHPLAAAASGAVATLLHDSVITPMDVVKQRLQLGYYNGVGHCLRTILAEEGLRGLYRSYPTTVLMNIPYASVVVSANESIKKLLAPADGSRPGLWSYMLAGAGAGALGAAATCPLDVIKTRLQTAALAGRVPPAGLGGGMGGTAGSAGAASSTSSGALRSVLSASLGSSGLMGPASGALGGQQLQVAKLYTATGPGSGSGGGVPPVRDPGNGNHNHLRALAVARELWREGGAGAFFKGVRARMLVHTPSMGISWGTYETVKMLLAREFPVSVPGS